ncbi:MAG: L,D-transpeptidase family protein [Pseudomonadota bacterium]
MFARPALADIHIRPPADIGVIGQVQYIKAHADETLLDIARDYDIGQNEILVANPDVDRWLPGDGTVITLPKRHVLPDAKRDGLILNLPEMRLYYFPAETPVVITHPVSIGRMDWETPLGLTKVVAKKIDPTWTPPQSIKNEALAAGEPLPDVIPAGPDNPLGRYAMRLGVPGYLIHSTNKPWGVGMRVTHGCVRMYPEDIEALFDDIPVGAPVQIVNQPIKLGWLADSLYLEIHPIMEDAGDNPVIDMQTVLDRIAEFVGERPVQLNGRAIRLTVETRHGMPVLISR